MLLQASTHSSNFDENTDNTSLSLTVVAYQWGWSYFFPVDALRSFGGVVGAHWAAPACGAHAHTCLRPRPTVVEVELGWGAEWGDGPTWLSPATQSGTHTVVGDAIKATHASIRAHNLAPQLPKLLDDVDMAFYAQVRGCEFGTTRQPAPASLTPSWGGGLVRRMHVTAGLALPSDTPIHVTCGSKDVIHSWAIPGLLIKIDCIPGYNVHRRLLVRWRGLFWGQCMEVCGRYHHWMPLLVHVSHADVFAAWLAANDA